MANAGPNTNGSQFFVMHADYGLPPNYTIFGKLTAGEDVVDAIATAADGRAGPARRAGVDPLDHHRRGLATAKGADALRLDRRPARRRAAYRRGIANGRPGSGAQPRPSDRPPVVQYARRQIGGLPAGGPGRRSDLVSDGLAPRG